MKKFVILSTVLNLLAICLFITGIILMSSEINTELGLALNSLGSACLIFGIFLGRKTKDN